MHAHVKQAVLNNTDPRSGVWKLFDEMEQVHMMKLHGMCSFLMHKYDRIITEASAHGKIAMGAATNWFKVGGCK